MDEEERKVPLPPKELSVYEKTKNLWNDIIGQWEKGWHAETQVERVDQLIEHHRVEIFEKKAMDQHYDWETDWLNAFSLHNIKRDFVLNRRAHNDALKALWLEWYQETTNGLRSLSLEALRGMILVDGAAILA